MVLFRLSGYASVSEAFNGDGAKKYGGRWNRKGTAIVYTASTLSLAALEVLVHTDSDILPELHSFTIDVPDDILADDLAGNLPGDWRIYPPPETLQEIGTRWVAGPHSVLLKVPSAIIPSEWNFLLDPNHADFKKLTVVSTGIFNFDFRLRK